MPITSREDAFRRHPDARSHAAAGVELRWPWVKAAASGATHVIEPVVAGDLGAGATADASRTRIRPWSNSTRATSFR
jgi:hypothetical protein